MKFQVRVPPVAKEMTRNAINYQKALRRAAIEATDQASREAQRALKDRIRAVGLGRLGGAVGQTSMKRERRGNDVDRPYGVLFARGGDESLAGGALESYSKGSVIVAKQRRWLAFATKAVPKFVTVSGRRFRTTPELYKISRLQSSIGPLIFKPISGNKAVLVVRKVTLSPKTGQAKARGPRAPRSRVPANEVVAFVLIRVTRRAQRFDKDAIVLQYARRVPALMLERLDVPGGYRSTR